MGRFAGTPVKKPRFGGSSIKGLPGDVGSEEFKEETNRNFDDDWDYSGIPRAGLRADVSRGDDPEGAEAGMILAKRVGKQNVVRDSNDRLGVTPEGAKILGIDTGGKNLSVDGRNPFEIHDVTSDLVGVAPEIAGGIAGAVATGGLGPVAAVAGTAGMAMLGKMGGEAADELQGFNSQTPGEVFTDVGAAGLTAGTEEIGGRIVMRAGRKLLRPNARSLKDGASQAIKDAEEIGIVPKVSNLKDDPIYRRIQGLLDTVLGDRNAMRNIGAFKAEMQRLRNAFGDRVEDPTVFGDVMRQGFASARQDFGDLAASKFAVSDRLLGDAEIIPTGAFKEQVNKFIKNFALTKDGKSRIAVNKEDLRLLEEMSQVGDNISGQQWQTFMTDLIDRGKDTTGTPGIGAGRAKQLVKALNKSFDDGLVAAAPSGPGGAGNPFWREGLAAMKDARKWYGENIQKFDNHVARKLAKPGADIGGIPDDKVLDFVLQKGSSARIKELKGFMGPDEWAEMQSQTIERVFETQDIADINPLDKVFDGTVLRKRLNSFGRANSPKDADRVLSEVLGTEHVQALRKLSSSMELASSLDNNSGGIVAQAIAVRPFQNIGKIAQMVVLRRFMNNPKRLEWLTTGIRFGDKTEAGAKALARVSAQMTQLTDDFVAEMADAEQLEESAP